MGKLSTNLGTTEQGYKLDGTNSIDIFPIFTFDTTNPTNPTLGSITIQGLTYRTELWSEGDQKTIKWELNHMYKSGEDCELHARIFPTNDLSGTFSFSFEYYVLHVDGTTSLGDTVVMSGSFDAGDKTANKGKYVNAVIDGTSLVSGDMLIGVMTRDNLSYNDDVSPSEFGLHIPIGKQGDNFGG